MFMIAATPIITKPTAKRGAVVVVC